MEAYFHDVERSLFEGRNGFELARGSIPLKRLPWGAKILEPSKSGVEAITSREATALIIAAKAAGEQQIRGGAIIPRRFQLGGAGWIIENGCGQDIVHSRAAGLLSAAEPLNDAFVLTNIFVEGILESVAMPRILAFLTADKPSRLDS